MHEILQMNLNKGNNWIVELLKENSSIEMKFIVYVEDKRPVGARPGVLWLIIKGYFLHSLHQYLHNRNAIKQNLHPLFTYFRLLQQNNTIQTECVVYDVKTQSQCLKTLTLYSKDCFFYNYNVRFKQIISYHKGRLYSRYAF